MSNHRARLKRLESQSATVEREYPNKVHYLWHRLGWSGLSDMLEKQGTGERLTEEEEDALAECQDLPDLEVKPELDFKELIARKVREAKARKANGAEAATVADAIPSPLILPLAELPNGLRELPQDEEGHYDD